MSMKEHFTVSEVVEQCKKKGYSVTNESLRQWEKLNMIPTLKRDSWERRIYSIRDLKFIEMILRLRTLDVSLSDIKVFNDFLKVYTDTGVPKDKTSLICDDLLRRLTHIKRRARVVKEVAESMEHFTDDILKKVGS